MADITLQMDRAALIEELRNPEFAGAMIHLRSWFDLQALMHRAADLLQEDEEDAIVCDALAAGKR